MTNKPFDSKDSLLRTNHSDIKSPKLIYSKIIIFSMICLITAGMFNLYSATNANWMFWSQFRNLGIGVVFFVLFAWFVSPKLLNTYCYWFFGFICILLIWVDIFGSIVGGSQRWLRIGGFAFQPSEFAKIALAIAVAKFFYTTRLSRAYNLKDLIPVAVLIGLVFILIFLQPDLGTAGVCAIIAGIQIAFVRVDKKSLSILAVSAVILGVFGWFFFLHDYQKLRILNLLNPDMDPANTGYNALQSLVAIGSGELTGKGFMAGTQTQLQFLPARYTDFIFSVFSEEHGFLGATLLFAFFVALIYSGLLIAKQSRDVFNTLLSIGCSAILFVSITINIAMVLGLFPVVGVPLPFFSHGGTALIMFCMSLGILVGIERDNLGLGRKSRPFGVAKKEADPVRVIGSG